MYIVAINVEIYFIATVCCLATVIHTKLLLLNDTEWFLIVAWSLECRKWILIVVELSTAEICSRNKEHFIWKIIWYSVLIIEFARYEASNWYGALNFFVVPFILATQKALKFSLLAHLGKNTILSKVSWAYDHSSAYEQWRKFKTWVLGEWNPFIPGINFLCHLTEDNHLVHWFPSWKWG